MRSLIKSHRRSDSSTSETASELAHSRPRPAKTTPLTSPQIPQNALNLTPPQTISGSLSNTISSPKKLLTPIKKMFGHHSKSNLSPGLMSTGDSLNAVINNKFEPPKGRRDHIKFANSYTSLSELQKSQSASTKPLVSSALMEVIHSSLNDAMQLPPPKLAALSTYLDSSVESQSKENMSIIFDKGLGLPMSHESHSLLSIANSEGNFKARESLSQDFLADSSSKGDTGAEYEDDDDLKDSDASSQFSFVKDMRGGRNTSVKYYKTKPSKAATAQKAAFFQVDDMEYENEALSDYDFENNGMDDDDILEDDEYDEFQTTNRYNDFLDNDDPFVESRGIEQDDNEFTPDEEDLRSYHDEVVQSNQDEDAQRDQDASSQDSQTPEETESNNQAEEISVSGSEAEPPQFSFMHSRGNTPEFVSSGQCNSPGDAYTEDLLDSYLDQSKLPVITNLQTLIPRSTFETFAGDSPSPLINGVTFGSEQKFRSQRNKKISRLESSQIDNREENEEALSTGLGIGSLDNTKRQSIMNMMDLLGSLEASAPSNIELNDTNIQDMKTLFKELDKQNLRDQPANPKRSLVINMMSTLANLENALNVPSEELRKKARDSIADMMKTLAALEVESENTISPQETPKATQDSEVGEKKQERYTWLTAAETKEPHENVPQVVEDTSAASIDQANPHLDEDLLDEVNQLPEDFDFEEHQNLLEMSQAPGFFRSNSYNKKPQKSVMENSFQKNKIETSQKTVTFYKTGTLYLGDKLSLSEKLNRNGSVRSATSFVSFPEEEESDDSESRTQKHMPYSIHHNSHHFEVSNDSVSRKSCDLEPITESDGAATK